MNIFSNFIDFLWLVGISVLSFQSLDSGEKSGYKPVNIDYIAFEPSSGTNETLSPIIFVHGLTSSKEYWEDIPQKIADATKRKAYAYDARNHGQSGYSDDFSFDLNVEDLFHFMDSKHVQKAVLIGHSMGGITASYAALSKPERVEKIFVEDMYVRRFPQSAINAGLPLLHISKESTQHMPKGLSETEAWKFSNDFLIQNIPKDVSLIWNLEEIETFRMNFKRNPDGSYDVNYNFESITRALKDVSTLMSDPEGQFEGSAYFIIGPLSPLAVYNEEEKIREHFPNAEFFEVKDAGHNIHADFPNEFVQIVVNNL